MNANTIITAALRKLLVISTGATPTAAQYAVGLELLNDMVREWSAHLDLVYEDTYEELTIPANTQVFTIGPSGDQVTVRPIKITNASLKEFTTEFPLRIADTDRYQNARDKAVTGLPYFLFYRETFPNGTVYFDKTSDKVYTMLLTSIKQLTEFPDGETEISLPAHYEKAFKDNLTIEIAPEMGASKRITPLMLRNAERSKGAVIGNAIKINASTTELGRRGSYNIEGDIY